MQVQICMNTPEAYEKLIYDSMRGDSTNFTHWDEVALSWSFVDTISEAWERKRKKVLRTMNQAQKAREHQG